MGFRDIFLAPFFSSSSRSQTDSPPSRSRSNSYNFVQQSDYAGIGDNYGPYSPTTDKNAIPSSSSAKPFINTAVGSQNVNGNDSRYNAEEGDGAAFAPGRDRNSTGPLQPLPHALTDRRRSKSGKEKSDGLRKPSKSGARTAEIEKLTNSVHYWNERAEEYRRKLERAADVNIEQYGVIKEHKSNEEALKNKVEQVENLVKRLKEDLEGMQQMNEGLVNDNGRLKAKIEGLFTASQEKDAKAKQLLSQWEQRDRQREQIYLEKLRANEAKIIALTTDIARLSHDAPDSIRDDHYLKSKISGVFLNLQNWVLQNFLMANIDDSVLASLDPKIQASFEKVAGPTWKIALQSNHVLVIRAFIASHVCNYIMEPFLCGMGPEGQVYNWCLQNFNGTEEDMTKWKILMVRMLIAHKDFSQRRQSLIERFATDVEMALLPLAAKLKSPSRLKRLKTLLSEAAEVAIECQKEPSGFKYHSFAIGTPCNDAWMEDAEGRMNNETIAKNNGLVGLTVSPCVLRTDYKAGSEPLVICKAKVFVRSAEDLENDAKHKQPKVEDVAVAVEQPVVTRVPEAGPEVISEGTVASNNSNTPAPDETLAHSQQDGSITAPETTMETSAETMLSRTEESGEVENVQQNEMMDLEYGSEEWQRHIQGSHSDGIEGTRLDSSPPQSADGAGVKLASDPPSEIAQASSEAMIDAEKEIGRAFGDHTTQEQVQAVTTTEAEQSGDSQPIDNVASSNNPHLQFATPTNMPYQSSHIQGPHTDGVERRRLDSSLPQSTTSADAAGDHPPSDPPSEITQASAKIDPKEEIDRTFGGHAVQGETQAVTTAEVEQTGDSQLIDNITSSNKPQSATPTDMPYQSSSTAAESEKELNLQSQSQTEMTIADDRAHNETIVLNIDASDSSDNLTTPRAGSRPDTPDTSDNEGADCAKASEEGQESLKESLKPN